MVKLFYVVVLAGLSYANADYKDTFHFPEFDYKETYKNVNIQSRFQT